MTERSNTPTAAKFKPSTVQTAAIVAGAGLGLAGSANAGIIFTGDNSVVPNTFGQPFDARLGLDLDGDSVTDFSMFYENELAAGYNYTLLNIDIPGGTNPNSNRVVEDTAYVYPDYAAALNAGALIGPLSPFDTGYPTAAPYAPDSELNMASSIYSVSSPGGPTTAYYGTFLGVTEKYLGVEFDISGATHYGWICVNVDATSAAAQLCGYAYESVADTGIVAGAVPEPDSMLLMAAGAMPLLAYRRRRRAKITSD